jgi:hypothetical protein
VHVRAVQNRHRARRQGHDGAAGSFAFSQNVDASGNFNLSDNGTKVYTNVLPGTFTVTESDPGPGFELTDISCTDPTTNSTGNTTTRAATINLASGEEITCTFTNRKKGTIIIEKQTNPNGAAGTFTFVQTGDPSGNFNLSDNGTKTFSNVVPGQYTVTENDPTPGFNLQTLECNDANSTESVANRAATINDAVRASPVGRCIVPDRRGVFQHDARATAWAGGVRHGTDALRGRRKTSLIQR